MKNREENIENTFLKLLEERNIETIDVQTIVDALGIKRQTFYYHYKNIYDLILSLMQKEELEIKEETDYDKILLTIIDKLYEKEFLFKEILKSSANDIIQEFTFSYFYRSLLFYLNKFNLSIDAKKDVDRFLTNSITNQLLYYYSNGDYFKTELFKKMECLINEDVINYIVNNYKNLNN